jgi:hypothetical protein
MNRKVPCPSNRSAAIDEAIKRFRGRGYRAMQQYVKDKFGFVPKTCWIAHRKEVLGFSPRPAWNRGK